MPKDAVLLAGRNEDGSRRSTHHKGRPAMTRSVKTALTACTAAAALFAVPAGAHAGMLSVSEEGYTGQSVQLAKSPLIDCSTFRPLDGTEVGTIVVHSYSDGSTYIGIAPGVAAHCVP
jgi:hypothetical protein